MKRATNTRQVDPYPVIDLFAGPGGLGEGFSSALDCKQRRRFSNIVSIERDTFSHQTLLMRHFFRHFPIGEVPDDYYKFLEGRIDHNDLFARHPEAYEAARQTALRVTLGIEAHAEVRRLIHDRLKGRDKWVLVGGPPCQAYSLVGRSRMMGRPEFTRDERHTLYLEYLKIIADHRPPIFVMENVKGLLSAKIGGLLTVHRIMRDLQHPASAISGAADSLGYRLYSLSQEEVADPEVDPRMFIVRAENYGIPQARHRMFIVGIRNDLRVRLSTLRPMVAPTVRETIGSLPAIRSSISRQADDQEAWLCAIRQVGEMDILNQLRGTLYSERIARALTASRIRTMSTPRISSSTRYPRTTSNHEVLRAMRDERLNVLTAHEARSHMPSDLRRYFFAATFAKVTGQSPKLADFPARLLPVHQNVEEGCAGRMFSDRFRVQLADHVATTITSHISKDGHYFIHYDPNQCRSLTVREAARLQTFPDNYYFAGPRTSQYHQVGNAVPPQLASQIADIVAEVLDSIRSSS